MPMHASPTFQTEIFYFVCHVYNNIKVNIMACTVLVYPYYEGCMVSTKHFKTKTMSTNYTDYSCHIKALEFL